MTGERLVGEPVRSDRPGNGTQALDVAEILGLCDSIVGHPGRRRHLFGWLKAPGAGPEQWLVVDSYYPVLGVALLVIVFAEVYGLVVRAGLDQGRLLLAFGIALDTCARTLGTVAAGRSGSQGWAWACALGGSPVVAGFAIFQGDGPVRTEPAPLAGLIALLASLLIAVALAAASLGI
jgi:hypothetical protein